METFPEIDSVEFARALADDTRQRIMKLCCCCWLTVNEITAQIGVAQPTISHHLAILRDAGLVHIRHDGRQTWYTLNQERIAVCCGRLVVSFAPQAGQAQPCDSILEEGKV
jgi:DNA-binding transcriptional ArsR family regulator